MHNGSVDWYCGVLGYLLFNTLETPMDEIILFIDPSPTIRSSAIANVYPGTVYPTVPRIEIGTFAQNYINANKTVSAENAMQRHGCAYILKSRKYNNRSLSVYGMWMVLSNAKQIH